MNMIESYRFTAAVSMSIAYGYDVLPRDDRFVEISEKAVLMMSDSTFPGAQLVSAFPIRETVHASRPPFVP